MIFVINEVNMSMLKKVRDKWNAIPLTVKVSTSYAVCSILQRCLSFITMPLFTRLLTTEQYGQYTVYTSWFSILNIFLTLNLAYGSFSTAMVKFEEKRDEYIASIEGLCLLLCTIFCMIYFPFRKYWNRMFELPTFIVFLLICEILFSTAIVLWTGKKRFEFKYKSVIAQSLLASVISPVFTYILVCHSDEKGYARIIGYALTTITMGSCFYIFNFIKGKRLYNREFWKYALGFNIPLLAYYISQVIFNQSDRIMISRMSGTDKAAMYGVAYNLAMMLIFVLNAINNSYVPWFYGKLKEGKTEENKPVSCIIAVIMAVLLLAVIWFAPEIILVMAGEQYYEAIWVVAPVSMSLLLLFYSQLFINVEFYYEEKKALIWASIGAAIVNIVLNRLLIPEFGFIAAGYTTLISYILFAVANYFAMKSVSDKKGISIDAYNLKGLIGIFMAFICMSFVGVILYNYFILRIVIATVAFLILLRFRTKIARHILVIRQS